MPSKNNFIVLFVSLMSLTALGAESAPHCYLFKPGSVEAVEKATESTLSDAETWCYQKVETPQPGQLIYMVSSGKVKPELTMFVGKDGYLIHNSLVNGKMTTHKVKAADFNPFSVPLTEPNVEERMTIKLDDSTVDDAYGNLKAILSQQIEDEPMTIAVGNFKAQAAHLPWRGYWFPQRGQTIAASLRKYDAYMKAKTGTNPDSTRYERNHHGWTGEVWEGHCNGWAAASVLNDEPLTPKTDPETGITFSVLDQKALLTERDYCVTHTFFGSRYTGPNNNLGDIRPAVFHKTLVYYIGQLQKAVATDYDRTETVNNAVISGYNMTITKTGSRTFKVIAIVNLHHYDKTKSQETGVARVELKRYSYSIRVNEAGEIIGGNWMSGNPDFLWVPLSSTPCSKNNQRLDPARIEEILNLGATPAPTEP